MIKVLVAGDYYPGNDKDGIFEGMQLSEIFSDFLLLLKEYDYNIVNLECPVLELQKPNELFKTGVHLYCRPYHVKALKNAGFQLVTLANNHILDYGNEGLKSTFASCNAMNIDVVGCGRNLEEAQKPLYKNIKGRILAIVNFCENEFSIATKKQDGANPLNSVANYYQIKEANDNSDYVLVIIHGGHEHFQLPSPRMKELYRFFIDAGAHAVICHHAHCYSGYEIYKGFPIIYGIGNFLFNSSYEEPNTFYEGLAIGLIFEDEKVQFKQYPLIQCRENYGVRFMNNEETVKNRESIEELNKVIMDDELLEKEFIKFIEKRSRFYLSSLEPYHGRLGLALYSRRLLPSLLTRRKIAQNLGIIRCESHRDILIKILDKKYNCGKV